MDQTRADKSTLKGMSVTHGSSVYRCGKFVYSDWIISRNFRFFLHVGCYFRLVYLLIYFYFLPLIILFLKLSHVGPYVLPTFPMKSIVLFTHKCPGKTGSL